MCIPALLAKKANAPVQMRINQEEEHYIGRVRPAFHGRMKVGFAKDGRITALDMTSTFLNNRIPGETAPSYWILCAVVAAVA